MQDERVDICTKYKPTLKGLAESGDVFAIYMLGICYINQTDEDIDYLSAIEWFLKASSLGFYRAFYSLASRYYYGQGVDRDFDRALKYLEQATAFPEYINALGTTADIYYDKQEYKEALDFYLRYIEIGGTSYFSRVGYMYMEGQGIEKDFHRAISYLERGAALGIGACYTNMGWIYENDGSGISQNLEKAAEYYQEAAELGDDVGQANLAYCYLNGGGVPYDREEAKYWLEKSAAQGCQRAKDMLRDNFGIY